MNFHFLSHTHHHDYQLFSNFHRHEPKSSRSPFSVLRPLPHPSSVEPKPPESYALRSPPPFSTPPSRQVPTDYCLTPRPTPYRILPKASGTAAGDPVDKIDHQRQQLFFFPRAASSRWCRPTAAQIIFPRYKAASRTPSHPRPLSTRTLQASTSRWSSLVIATTTSLLEQKLRASLGRVPETPLCRLLSFFSL